MSLYLRETSGGGHWWIDIRTPDGRRIRRSTRTKDKRLAQTIHDEVARSFNLARYGLIDLEETGQQEVIVLGEFIDKYINFARSSFEPKTVELIYTSFKALTETVKGDPTIDKIRPQHIEHWKVHVLQTRKPTTLSMYFRTLAAAFERARTWGYIESNPFRSVERPRTRKDGPPPAFFSDEQIVSLLETAGEDSRFGKMIKFYLYTGLRRNELIYLEWEDVNLVRREVEVVASKARRWKGRDYHHRTKNGLPRRLPINDSLLSLLEQLLNEQRSNESLSDCSLVFPCPVARSTDAIGPWSERAVSRKFKKLIHKAELPTELSLHSLRHTFASNLVQRGISLYIVGKLLGHTSLEVTKIYSHLTPESYTWAVEGLNFEIQSLLSRTRTGEMPAITQIK